MREFFVEVCKFCGALNLAQPPLRGDSAEPRERIGQQQDMLLKHEGAKGRTFYVSDGSGRGFAASSP